MWAFKRLLLAAAAAVMVLSEDFVVTEYEIEGCFEAS
jgi:hypothetical protein